MYNLYSVFAEFLVLFSLFGVCRSLKLIYPVIPCALLADYFIYFFSLLAGLICLLLIYSAPFLALILMNLLICIFMLSDDGKDTEIKNLLNMSLVLDVSHAL